MEKYRSIKTNFYSNDILTKYIQVNDIALQNETETKHKQYRNLLLL